MFFSVLTREADLKMENVGISGFDNDKPNRNHREIIVRLADLGAGEAISQMSSSRRDCDIDIIQLAARALGRSRH